MEAFDFARLVRLFASACAPVFLLLFAAMAFSVAAPQRAEAAGTCTINWGTVAYRSTNNTYVMSQSVNPAALAACDPRYPAVDSGVAPPTSGTSANGGTWSGVTNAADNTLTYTPPPGRIGADSFTMYFCNDASCSGAGRLTATVNVTIAAPTLTLTSSLPGGTQGSPYSQTLTAAGGASAYGFTVVSGSLPPGLSLGAVSSPNASTSTVALSGTPTAGGTYNFTIRATDSSTGSGPVSVDQTYNVSITALPPTITAIAPTAGPTAGGTTVVITGTNLTGATAVNFGANPAIGVTVNSSTQITATAPAGSAGTIDVRVTTSGGTSTITAADQYSYVAAPTVTALSPTSGPNAGGTTVILTGTNLSGATAVNFGATPATGFTVNSATQITATSPAGTGTVNVRVTTLGGGSATAPANLFTYAAAPTVTSVAPTAGPTTGGTTVILTGTNLSGATAVNFGATAATGFTVNSATQITATVPAGTGTVDIRVTTLGGTSVTTAADQFTYVAAPTVTSISPTAGPATGGTTVVVTGTNLSGATAVTFGATAATGFTVNSATQITATAPSGTGTVDVRITTLGGTSATTAADQFTYVAAPTVTSISPTAGPATGGTTVVITGTNLSGATAVNFGATAATGFTVNSATQITATAPAGTGTIDIRITTAGGTSATTAADQFTYVSAPVATSFTYGSVVAYNAGSNLTTSFNLSSQATGSPTGYAVGSATTAQGGSVSVDNTGQVTYTPPVGFRNANDSFTWTATNNSGTSTPATTTLTIGNPTLSISLAGSGTRGVVLSGVQISTAGGQAPYSCATTVASGALPAGVALNADCSITGAPAASGTFNFTVNVTDSSTGAGGFTAASGPLTLTIAAPTLSLSPASGALPGATAGGAWSQTFTASGGTASYSYATTAGALPPGLTLTGGVLSGTPTAVGTFNFAITATDSSSAGSGGPYTVTTSYSITVAAPTITLTPASLPNGAVGTAYVSSVSASGGTASYTYTVTAGALPVGMSLASTGALSGTPTAGGTFNFTITATDSTTGAGAPYSGSRAYSVTVGAPTITVSPTTLTNATVGASYNATLTAGGGTASYSYAVTAGALPAGVSLAGNGTLSGAPTAGGTFNFTVTATDSSGGAGPYSGSRAYALTVAAPTIALTPTTLPNAAAGAAYSQAITASGGTSAYSYGVTAGALPAGLTLSSSGALSGTPTAGGTFNFTVTATDSSTGAGPYTGSRAYALTVASATVVVSPATLPNATAGTAYSQTVTASGGNGPYSYALTAGALPPGWNLSAAGVLSGTATASNVFNFTITATDSSTGSGPYSGSRSYSVTVGSPSFTLTPPTLSGTVGQAYTGAFVAGGGTAPYTYTRFSGTLPPGLTLATDGTLSGTPTSGGTFNFSIVARDTTAGGGAPYGVASNYNFTVAAPTLTLTPSTLADGAVNAAYTASVSASGGTAPYTYAVTAGALPAGISLATNGTLSGTPTGTGVFNFTITATDSSTGSGAPFSASRAYAITIGQGAQTISFGALADASLSDSPLTLSATASSGLTVSFLSDTTAICAVSGTSLTLLQTGTCTIRAEQAGDAGYAAAAPVSRSFAVTPATLDITADPAAGLVVGDSYSQTNTASGGVAPYTYRLLAGAFAPGTTLDGTTGVVSGTPIVAGTFSYVIRATDDQPLTADTPVITVTIAKGSQTIAFTSTAPSAVVAGPDYVVTATASSGLGVTFTLDGSSTGCTLSGATVSFTAPGTCVINADQAGDANWNAATRVQQSVTVIANPPIAADVSGVTVAYDSAGTAIDLSGSLTGGAHTSIAIGTAPAHGTTSIAGDVVTYTPATGYYGADSFTFTATGPGGTSNVATVTLTVATPAAPVATDKSGVAVPWNSPGTAIELSTSITGVHAILAIGTAPAHGTTSIAGQVVTYTPATGYYGADSFTFTATGPGGTSNVATVTLTVGVPPAPTAADVNAGTVPFASSGVVITLQPAGVYTSLSVATAPAHGTVQISGTTATYVPAADYFGADSFTYTATGPGGTSAPATVSLTVATPPPPVVIPPTDPVVVPPSTGGGSQPVTVNLDVQAAGEIDGFRITVTAQYGSAVVTQVQAQAQTTGAGGPQKAPGDYQLVYTPAANFMGTDTVTVVAFGPGGDSSPLTFTFQVAGKAPDLSGQTPSNGSVTFTPTTTLVGGPFQALRITRAPAFGAATINGLSIVFTPGAANGGSTSLDYVIDLPFGSSAAGRIDLVSNLVPGAQALTAETVQGHPVTVRISNTAGGPFTGAAVVSVSPTSAGTATIAGSGAAWDLTFTPTGTFSGVATVTFSLTNASGTTNGTLAVTVEARPDPGLDPEVRGVATSQVTAARRFADAQINNFQRRLRDLHDGTNASSNGVSLNFGLSQDDDRDPRQALRRQLGQNDHRLDPGALGDDRDREMLGLDLWSGRASASVADPGGGRLNMAGGQPSTVPGRGSVGFWTSGSIDWGRQDADGVRDSRFTTQGVTAGLDVQISDQLIIGGGLGYGEDKTRIGDNGSVSNGQAVTGALYASWRPADAFYIDGVLGYADLDFDSRRWVTGLAGQPDGYAGGSRSGDVRFLSATFGRLMRNEGFTTDLYARLDARDIALDGFTETGGGLSSLIWSEVDQSSVSANLGASWRWVVDYRQYGLIRPSARLEWSHEFEDIGDQAVRYADWAASPSYLVPLSAWSRDSLNLDLDAEWSLSDRLVLGVGYRGALGDASTSHGAQIRVQYGW